MQNARPWTLRLCAGGRLDFMSAAERYIVRVVSWKAKWQRLNVRRQKPLRGLQRTRTTELLI